MKPQKKGFYPHLSVYQDLRGVAGRFMSFCEDYSPFFAAYRHNVSEKAQWYLAGLLMKAPRKNIERIDEYVDGSNYEACQHFLSESPWSSQALNNQIAHDVDALLGGEESVLCIDESGFSKKGKSSAGVARQWNGRLGKVDNCQVGVFTSLCNGSFSSIVDYRLFLPKEWISSPDRCEKAKIPENFRTHKTKLNLALDMIIGAVENGVRFGWVAGDAFYGRDSKLLNELEDRGIRFVMDIQGNHMVYINDPKPYLPRRRNKIGPKHKKLRAREDAVTVESIFDKLEHSDWIPITIRDSTKGKLRVEAHRKIIFDWNGEEKHARKRSLVLVRFPSTGERKYFISNVDDTVSIETLVKKHACRYWIERCFQDGKTSLGMADYQVRNWIGWQHHMSMVSLAMLFMLKERMLNKAKLDLLSFQDIVELLDFYLPRKDRNEEAVLNNMYKRHKKRERSIKSAYDKQKNEVCST